MDTGVAHTSVYSVPRPTSGSPYALSTSVDSGHGYTSPGDTDFRQVTSSARGLMTCTRAGRWSETDSFPPFRLTMSASIRVTYGLPMGTGVAHTELCSVPLPTYGSPICPCPHLVSLSSHHRKWKTRQMSLCRRRVPFRHSSRLTWSLLLRLAIQLPVSTVIAPAP